MLGILFGGISAAALLRSILGYCLLHGIYPHYGEIDAAGSRRFDVFIRSGRTYDNDSVEAVLIRLYPLLPVVLFSLLIVAAVLTYRRMEAETRFHPGLCAVSTVLAWAVTAAMLICRFRMVYALEPADYGVSLLTIHEPLEEQAEQLTARGNLPLLTGGTGLYIKAVLYDYTFLPQDPRHQQLTRELEQWPAEQLAERFGIVWAAVVLAVVLLAVLLRRCTGAGSGAAVLCMVMQMPLWYFAVASNYLMEVDVTASYTDLYARGTITLYPNEFAGTLLLSLLIWAICTLLSGIRRTADLLKSGRIVICDTCADCLRELALYRWEEGREAPHKDHDHAMDDMRYFAADLAAETHTAAAVGFVERGRF